MVRITNDAFFWRRMGEVNLYGVGAGGGLGAGGGSGGRTVKESGVRSPDGVPSCRRRRGRS